MEAASSTETSVDFQQTTQRYFPEDKTFHFSVCSKYIISLQVYLYFCEVHMKINVSIRIDALLLIYPVEQATHCVATFVGLLLYRNVLP
jgi:hypothetical protein